MQQQQQTQKRMMQRLLDQQQAPPPATAPAPAPGFGPQQNDRDRDRDGEKLVAKFFKCQQFSGKAEHWGDFQFRFKRAVWSQSARTYHMMGRAETTDETFEGNFNDSNHPETSATLFDILCQHVEGDAMMIMEPVTDCNGFEAWRALHSKYNPRSFARSL